MQTTNKGQYAVCLDDCSSCIRPLKHAQYPTTILTTTIVATIMVNDDNDVDDVGDDNSHFCEQTNIICEWDSGTMYLMRLCYVYRPTDRCSYHAYEHSKTSPVQVNSQKLSWFWPLSLSVCHTQISAFYLKSIKWIFFSSDYIVSFRIVLYIRNMVWLIRLIEFCFQLPHK